MSSRNKKSDIYYNSVDVFSAFAASDTVYQGYATVLSIFVLNNNASQRYLLLFNRTAVPADGTAITKVEFPLACAPNNTTVVDFGEFGTTFNTGIVWVNSTTPLTKTIAGADLFVKITWQKP